MAGWMSQEFSGECPHCGRGVLFANATTYPHPRQGIHNLPFKHADASPCEYAICAATCPLCGRHVVDWWAFTDEPDGSGVGDGTVRKTVERIGIYPKSRVARLSPRVDADIAADYREADQVASVSTRAAAMLARRTLQVALRKAGFVESSKKLDKEIALALQDARTPSTLGAKLRFVQGVGNDAAHPNLDYMGDLIEVTEGDLVVIMAALDEFLDAYFVKPKQHEDVMKARQQRKKGP